MRTAVSAGYLPIDPAAILPRASSIAGEVDLLFLLLLIISGLILGVLTFGTGYFLIRYRAGSSAKRSPPKYNETHLEIVWIVVTLVVFLGIGFAGAFSYLRMAKPPDGESLEIYVLGRQWMWEVSHPGGRREHNQLHVPRGQTIRLNFVSEDVIHSFYVPAFRLKHDVLPQRTTSIWFEATESGTFDLFCAEFCGTEHHIMRGSVVVMDPADYAIWSSEGDQDQSLAAHGSDLFRTYGCAACHDPRAVVHAPNLEGLFGSAVYLEDGGFVIADHAYLHDSIMLPNKHIVAGYEPLMPTFQGIIPPEEVFALVEYIKSLSTREFSGDISQP